MDKEKIVPKKVVNKKWLCLGSEASVRLFAYDSGQAVFFYSLHNLPSDRWPLHHALALGKVGYKDLREIFTDIGMYKVNAVLGAAQL